MASRFYILAKADLSNGRYPSAEGPPLFFDLGLGLPPANAHS